MLQRNLNIKLKEKDTTGKIILILSVVFIVLCIVFSFVNGVINNGGKVLLINEVMTSNKSSKADQDGDYSDWIEILNAGDYPINLKDYGLSDDSLQPFKWRFPDITIEPHSTLLIFASGKNICDVENGYLHTNFRLDSNGEALYLNGMGQVLDKVKIPALPADVSYGRKTDETRDWAYFANPTPGAENNTDSYEKLPDGTKAENSMVLISEIMTSNKTSILDEDMDYSDWIEIVNTGTDEINIGGYYLSDDFENPSKWSFPDMTIGPGEYIVVFASGKNRRDPSGNLHTNFKLSSENENLIFSNSQGQIIDKLQIKYLNPNVSFGRKDGERDVWLYYPLATPGESNYTQGFESLTVGASPEYKTILINEVMVLNLSTLKDDDGEFSDWIELKNTLKTPVNLKGYGLSDDVYTPLKWTFPDIEIGPGEHLIVFASGKDKYNKQKNVLHTNFSLNAHGETIILSDPSGQTIDEFTTGFSEADVSCGMNKEGRVYYLKATPGEANTTKSYAGIAPEVKFSQKAGFYSSTFNLTLKTDNESDVIRYTLDGSEPDENSPIYTSPIKVSKSLVVRARAYKEGMLPGAVKTSTFFVNKEHTLSVVSLSTDPDNLWNIDDGIYAMGRGASPEFPYVGANFWKDIEKPVHFEFFESDGTPALSFDGGIKIFGSYSRGMDQKSFSIYARDRYGYDRINYPFFEDKQISEFKSILLRTSGQDAVYTKIRDAMMSRLIKDTGVDYQAYRPVVVYINGEYWGLYNIREKISPYFLASNHGVDPENVDILEADGRVKAGDNTDYKALVSFVKQNDMRVKENYEYVKSKMDIENFINYQIAEIYFANTDNGNIKFWRERSEGGKWRWILYDTDWGFFDVNHNTLWYVTNPEGTGVGKRFSTALMYNLLKNDEFKTEFINQLAYHLNNTFKTERVISLIDQMAAAIEPEMPENLERWGGSMKGWYNRVEALRDFARKRPKILASFIKEQFNLSSEEMKIFDVY